VSAIKPVNRKSNCETGTPTLESRAAQVLTPRTVKTHIGRVQGGISHSVGSEISPSRRSVL
jgi:hypothetical protein